MEKPETIRREVTFFGRVQGVGFRYQAHQMARSHPITGFVENLSDGTVLLVAEGSALAVDAYLNELCDAMKRYIARRETRDLSSSGEFPDFNIPR